MTNTAVNDNADTPVTVIGLGLMGQALAGAFLRAGYPTTVWNRTAAKAGKLVAEGARLAPTVGDALEAGSLTIICVTDYRAMHELLGADDVALDGKTLINLTSGGSAQARETARWAGKRGAHYLDGAIMAIPPAIGTAEAVILHSGPQPDFEAHKSTLEALGTVTYLGADHGLASLYDVAGLAMMWSVLNAWLQGTAMLRTAGVDAATFAPFAQQIAVGVAGWLPGWRLSDGELIAALSTAQAELDRVYARALELVGEVDSRGLATGKGFRDTKAFLVRALRISPQEAGARVIAATADLPVAKAALAAGEISSEHVREIAKVLTQAPDTLAPGQLTADEEVLVELARHATPPTVQKAGRRLLAFWDLDDTDPGDRDRDLSRPRREFRYSFTRDGRMKFSGEFDPEIGILAEHLLIPLA
jgi:3-hydroxyisobutyrate dehydrogenase-like beta-hydroxyacid dehydrogenase